MEKTFIITGASSDVGLAFLQRLQKNCQMNNSTCNVIAQYHSSAIKLEQLKEKSPNLNITLYRCDLAQLDKAELWGSNLKSEGLEPTHILHLAAPRFNYMRIKNFEWQKMQQEINVNAGALAVLLQKFLPLMAKKKYGRVLAMLTSYTINVPPKFMCDYIMAKYALLGLVRAAAAEYAGKGITVNGISPNMMETKFLADVDRLTITMNAENSAMKRNIAIEEVCAAMEYLLSDAAGYVNGINLNLSGGDRM